MKPRTILLPRLALVIALTGACATVPQPEVARETSKEARLSLGVMPPAFELGYRLTFTNPRLGEWDYVYRGQREGLLVFENVYKGETFDWLYAPDLAEVRSVGRPAGHDGRPEIENTPHNGMLKFPLLVGKRWQHSYTRAVGKDVTQRSLHAKVTAYERVTVPAGTFAAFRIETTNRRLDRALPAYETYWYAPEVKFIIKYESREFGWEFELLRYGPSQ
ncbi:MAG: hypothetical protein ACE5JN_06855 [Candidatus Methylomirabilia bacterium]